MQTWPQSRPLQHYSPSLRHPWRTVVKGNPPSGENFGRCTCMSSLEGKIATCATIHQLMGCSRRFHWIVRNLERTWLENWWQRNLGRRIWTDFSEWAKNGKTLVSHVNAHQRQHQQRRILIIKRTGCPVLLIRMQVHRTAFIIEGTKFCSFQNRYLFWI